MFISYYADKHIKLSLITIMLTEYLNYSPSRT